MDGNLSRLRQAIDSATAGMSSDAMGRHVEGKWSTAEVLEHLSLTYSGTIKGFERCLEAGKPLATTPKLKDKIAAFVVTKLGYLPEGRKAPSNTVPGGKAGDAIRTVIGQQIVTMDEVIGKCEQLYGVGVRLLDHPILGPFTARQWRRFHWIHGRHHLKQIARLRKM